jgi:hypothetical protein
LPNWSKIATAPAIAPKKRTIHKVPWAWTYDNEIAPTAIPHVKADTIQNLFRRREPLSRAIRASDYAIEEGFLDLSNTRTPRSRKLPCAASQKCPVFVGIASSIDTEAFHLTACL